VDPCVLPLGADCSVQEEECVDRVRAVITCMRDAEHPAPKIVRMTPDEYIDQLEEPEPATEEEARRSLQTVRAFTLLRLLPADPPQGSGEVYLPSPYISYDWEKGELLIVADGADPEAELAALLYTLVLADRDAEVGIAGLLAVSADDGRADGCGSRTTAVSPGHVLAACVASKIAARSAQRVASKRFRAAAREPRGPSACVRKRREDRQRGRNERVQQRRSSEPR
jgi:hypothetical protein